MAISSTAVAKNWRWPCRTYALLRTRGRRRNIAESKGELTWTSSPRAHYGRTSAWRSQHLPHTLIRSFNCRHLAPDKTALPQSTMRRIPEHAHHALPLVTRAGRHPPNGRPPSLSVHNAATERPLCGGLDHRIASLSYFRIGDLVANQPQKPPKPEGGGAE